MSNNNRNSKQDQRLSALETDVKWIKNELKTIKTNELEHIRNQIECIHKKLNSRPSWSIASIIAFFSIIIGALVTMLFG